jgi:hypothetical protein
MKPWAQTKFEYLIARMAGFESTKSGNPIPEFIREFMRSETKKRWLFRELETHFPFKRKPGNQRGIVFSMTLSRDDLFFEHEKSKHLRKSDLTQSRENDKKKGEEKFKKWLEENGRMEKNRRFHRHPIP